MNKFLSLFFLDFKLLSKTKTFYFKLILFPTVLILILGNIFENSNNKISSFNVAFYNEDKPSVGVRLGDTLKNDVFGSKDIKSIINLKEVTSVQEGNDLVKSGKADVFVHVPQGFTSCYISGYKTNITLTANESNQIHKSIVKNILVRFTQNAKTVMAEKKAGISSTSQNNIDYKIPKISPNKASKPIDIMQYESIAMNVMFSILTAFTLVHSIVSDKLNNTLWRIQSTPTESFQYVLGKLSGMAFSIVMQILILMLITKLCFGVKWGNPFYLLITTIVYCFAVSSIILSWGLAAKDQMSISSIASPVLYGFSFLGGSFVEKDTFSGPLAIIQKLIPNGKAINCYLKLCQGGNFSDIYVDLIQLIIMGVLFIVVSLIIFDGKRGKNSNADNDKKAVKAAA